MNANRGVLWSAIITTVIGWGPMASVTVAGAIANANGCVLNEGDVHPCIVAGADLGELLYAMGVMGWLMLLTFPLMLASLVLWIIVIVQWLRRPRTEGADDPGETK